MLPKIKIRYWLLFAIIIIHPQKVESQVSPKVIGERFRAYKDSIQHIDYAYILPIGGDKARKAGIDLQKPAGIMLGFLGQQQELTISNLEVGICYDCGMAEIDDFTEFEYIKTYNNVYTFRPDVWLFPFLNLYVQASKFYSRTRAKLSVPFEIVIPEVEKNGFGAGFGGVLAYGWGPIWATSNFNMAWSKAQGIDRPTQSIVNSIRLGTSFHTSKRNRSGSVWIGANYQNYLGSNSGSYDLTQLLPDEKPRLEEIKQQLVEWQNTISDKYEDYCNKPINKPQCAIIDQMIDEFKNRIDDKISGISPPELIINYGYKVSPKNNWNMVVGAQANISKTWQARFEGGFIGRKSFMFNLNYRLAFIRKRELEI
ncbi:hypothetical protein [Carboxylicivirga sp. RSCT41]|uniref:hypothetical protein n=1 Tax=Carboxylicivirga agarovorans TaxID=3417570 RepID=UPI003D352D0E